MQKAGAIARAVALLPYGILATSAWFLCDDAFISFRYARHLAEGHGLRFNLDRSLPVEGYSNLLWVLLAALPEAAGVGAPAVMPWVSLAAGAGLLWLVAGAVRARGGDVLDEVLALLALGTAAPMVTWATSGLATMPHVFLWFATARAVMAGRLGWALAAGLPLVLIRTEGPAWLLLATVAGVLGGGPAARAVAARTLGAGGALTLGWLAWRWGVYGDWLANTVRAKAGGTVGVWGRGLADLALMVGTLISPALWAALGLRAGRAGSAAGWWAMAAGAAAFLVLSGGDYLPFFRFGLALLPPLVVLAVGGLRGVSARGRAAVAVGLVVLNLLPLHRVHLAPTPLLNALHQVVGSKVGRFTAQRTLLDKERQKLPRRRARAQALATVTHPGERVVAKGIGVLGYETELVVLDRYGLVSREVAALPLGDDLRAPGHDKRVGRTFFLATQPNWLFVETLHQRGKGEVQQLMPKQWGLFEEIDGLTLVAELRSPPPREGRWWPTELLLVRPMGEGEDPDLLREAFKQAVRDAGYQPPKLAPLSDRRRRKAEARRDLSAPPAP